MTGLGLGGNGELRLIYESLIFVLILYKSLCYNVLVPIRIVSLELYLV